MALSFQAEIELDMTKSNENIKKELEKLSMSEVSNLKIGLTIDPSQLDALKTQLDNLPNIGDGIDTSKLIDATSKMGTVLKTVETINKSGTNFISKTQVDDIGRIVESQYKILENKEEELIKTKITSDEIKVQKQHFTDLLALRKTEGDLQKKNLSVGNQESSIIKEQIKDISKLIKEKELAIKNGGYEDEQLRKSITDQIYKNEKAITREKAKSKDDKQSQNYDKILRSQEKEYALRTKLIKANETDAKIIEQKIKTEQKSQIQAYNTLSANKLHTKQGKELVEGNREMLKSQLELKKVESDRIIAYDKLKAVTKEIGELELKQATLKGSEKSNEKLLNEQKITEALKQRATIENNIAQKGLTSAKMEKEVDDLIVKNATLLVEKETKLLDLETQKTKKAQEYSQAQVLRLNARLDGTIGGKNTGYEEVQEVERLRLEFEKLNGMSLAQAKKQVALLNTEITSVGNNATNKRIQETVNGIHSLGDSLKNLGIYVSGAMVVRQLWTEFRNGLQDVVALDSAMTTLSITMEDLTKTQINGLLKSSQDMATQLKANVNDVMTAVKTVANANETIDSILAKSKPAIILANLTGLGADQTVEMIQGSMQQFDELADGSEKSAMRVADSMVSISKSLSMDFSTGVSGMAESVEIMGSLANETGMDIEKMLSLVSATAEKTRLSFSEVSNALKTVMSRTMRVGNAELGIDNAEMLKTEKALNSVGIAIRNLETGEMRPFMNIMDDLAGKWDTLNDTQRMYVGDAMGGARQLSTVLATVQANTRATELYNIAIDGTGSAMMAQEEWATSLEAKLQGLSTSTTIFWQTFVNSEGYGSAIVMITDLINGVTTLVDTFGALPISIFAIGTALLLTSDKFRTLSASIVAGGISMTGFDVKTKATALGLKVLDGAMLTTKLSAIALQATLSLGLSFAISAVVGGISAMASGWGSASKKMDEANDSARKLNETLKANESDEIILKDMSKINNDLNEVATLEEKVELEQKLSDLKSSLSYNDEYNGILENENYSLEEQISLIEYLAERKKELSMRELEVSLSDTGGANAYEAIIAENVRQLQYYSDEKVALEESLKLQQSYREELIAKGEATSQVDSNIDSLIKQVDEFSRREQDSKSAIVDSKIEMDNYNNSVKTLKDSNMGLSLSYVELDDELVSIVNSEYDAKISTDNLGKKIKDTSDDVVVLVESLSKLNPLLSDDQTYEQNFVRLGKEIENVKSLLDDVSTDGLSFNEMENVLELFPEIGSGITDVIKIQDLLTSKISEMGEAQDVAYMKMVENDENYFNNSIKNTQAWEQFQIDVKNNMVSVHEWMVNTFGENYEGYFSDVSNAYSIDLSNCKNLAEARVKIESESAQKIAMIRQELYQASMEASKAQGGDWDYGEYHLTETSTAMFDAIAKIKSWESQAIGSLNKIASITKPTFGGMSSSMGSASQSAQKLVEDLENLADTYYYVQNAIDDVNNALAKNQLLQEYATPQDKIKLMKEEVKLLKDKAKAEEDMFKAQQEQQAIMQRTLKDNGFSIDSSTGDISNYSERIKQMTNHANSLSGEAKENAIKEVEALIDVVEEYIKLTNSELPKTEQSWIEALNAIKKAEREQLDYVTQVQKDITSAYEYEMRKRTESVKKELDKQKQLYNDQFEAEDYEDTLKSEQRKLDEIQQQINNLSRDTSQAGQLKLQQLLAEYEAQQEAINQIIRDKEKENGNQAFDDAMDELDKELEDALDPENLAKIMNDALATGMIQIGEETIKLDNLMSSWLDATGDGLLAVGNTLRSELIDSLEIAGSLLVDLNTGFKSLSTFGMTSGTGRSLPGGRSIESPSIEFNSPLLSIANIEGDLGNGVMVEINKVVDTMKQTLVNELAKQLSLS